jgi:hypothetical protein
VEKVTRRLVTMEKQHQALVKLVGDLLEVLSTNTETEQDACAG